MEKQIKNFLKNEKVKDERKKFYENHPLGKTWYKHIKHKLGKTIFNDDYDTSWKLETVQLHTLFNPGVLDENIQNETFGLWEKHFKNKGTNLNNLDNRFQESKHYPDDRIFTKYDKKFSLDFLFKLNIVIDTKNFCSNINTKHPVFLEIGGGYGSQARVFKLEYPDSCYILIDIPETLYFTYIYLKLNFPEANIVFMDNKNSFKSLNLKKIDFLLVPFVYSSYLKEVSNGKQNFDVVINTRSMGEMNNKTIQYYYNLFQILKVKYIISLNRFLNVIHPTFHKHRLNENGCYGYVDYGWNILEWEIEPSFCQFMYGEQSLETRLLYMIAERNKSNKYPQVLHNEFNDIFNSYWYNHFEHIPDFGNKYTHILKIDFTKQGELFKLWNATRFSREEKIFDAFIKYLYLISGRFPFEEWFFYNNKYTEYFGKTHFLNKRPLFKFKCLCMLKKLHLYVLYDKWKYTVSKYNKSPFMFLVHILFSPFLIFAGTMETADKWRRKVEWDEVTGDNLNDM